MTTSSSPQEVKSEWTLNSNGSLQRQLRGFELLINIIEAQQAGNCELILSADLTTSMTPAQLEFNIRPAWIKTRQQLPMTGVRLPHQDLSQAIFDPFCTVAEAERWCDGTIDIVADGRSVREVADECKNQPLDPATGRLPRVHLVSRPRSGDMGVVLHTSHVMNGHFIMTMLEEIARQLVEEDCSRGVQAVFRREEASDLLQRLPISANYAYENAPHIPAPTEQDLAQLASRQAEAAKTAAGRISIGAPVRADWQARQSMTNDTFKEYPAEMLPSLQQATRRAKVTLTAAFWACIILASLDFSTQDRLAKANGVECLFSTHTKRWFQAPAPGTAPVTMGVIPSSFWLDLEQLNLKTKNSKAKAAATPREVLVNVARQVMKAQKDAIESVHVLKQLELSIQTLFETTTLRGTQKLPSAEPTISRPTLTSQGVIVLPEWYGNGNVDGKPGGDGGHWLRYTDYRYGGRHTDPSVCFALIVFRGRLRIQALFDERFFEKHRATALIDRAVELLELWLQDESGGLSSAASSSKL